MKLAIFAATILLAAPAFAADPVPKPPACGKTAEECQKAVDTLTDQIADLQVALQGAKQQRDAAQQSNYDSALLSYVAQQKGARDAAKKVPAK